MTNAITTQPDPAAIIEQVVIGGDLAKLDPAQRVTYYRQVCDSLGLNPFTRPFDYITLNGKLTLYAKRDAADQLRKLHGVSVQIVGRERIDDVFVVTAHATMQDGRADESIGAVTVGNLKGDALANALMKAETKAKRRVTLSIVGLGWLDETEIETVRDARPATVNVETGEIVQAGGNGNQPPAAPMTEGQRKRLHGLGDTLYGPDWDTNRHRLVGVITKGRSQSSADLTEDEAARLIRGMEKKLDEQVAPAGSFPAAEDLHPQSAHQEQPRPL